MASWWVSDRLVLVPPGNKGLGKSTSFEVVDHAGAVRRIQERVGFAKATIKFDPKEHGVDIDVDPRTGKWGCPRIGTIKLSTMPEPENNEMAWSRQGETTWLRHGLSKKDSMEKLVNVIKDSMVMGTFEISRLPSIVAPFLAKALCQTVLVVLKITDSTVTKEVAEMISHILAISTTLQHLELVSCNFSNATYEHIRPVADALKKSELHTFRFGSSNSQGSLALGLLLSEGLVGHPTLTNLQFAGHKFHIVDAVAAQKLLSSETCMVNKVSIQNCSNAAVAKVTEGICGWFSWCIDWASCHSAKAAGIIGAVADALTTNQTVTLLDLSDTTVSDKDMEALAHMLTENTSLDELLMEDSCISEDGIISFASMLPQITRLRKLDLRRNHCGPKACEALKHGLMAGNFGLHVLNFAKGEFWGPCCNPPNYYNDCDEECRVAIECHLAVNRFGRSLLATNTSSALWPNVFARAQAEERTFSKEIIFSLLRTQTVALGTCKS